MTWNDLPPDVRQIAEQHCTQKELVALRLWENGCGYRRIGNILGISMSTARGRVHRALDRIKNIRAQEQNAPHRTTPDPLRKSDLPATKTP